MAEGEGGSLGEGPGGAGGRGGRGSLPLPGHRTVRLPLPSRAGWARPCPRRVGRAAPEVSGRWRGPRADTPGRGRPGAGGFASQDGAWRGHGRWGPARTCRRPLPAGGGAAGGSRPSRAAHPGAVRGLIPLCSARGFPWSRAGCLCCSLPVTCAGALLSGSGEICRVPGVLLLCLKTVNYTIQINLT